MEPTYYLYSKFYGWIGVIFFGGATLGMLYLEITAHNSEAILPLAIPELLCAGLLYYIAKWCFIPAVNGYVALELDEEKLHCYITDRTIYWKDVVEMSDHYAQHSFFVKFDMVDGSTLTVPTKWIAGRTSTICKKMEEYFARTL